MMERAVEESERVLVLLSPDYFSSDFTALERAPVLARDPTGERRLLVPIRVRPVEPTGFLRTRVYVDLVKTTRSDARKKLLREIDRLTSQPTARLSGMKDLLPAIGKLAGRLRKGRRARLEQESGSPGEEPAFPRDRVDLLIEGDRQQIFEKIRDLGEVLSRRLSKATAECLNYQRLTFLLIAAVFLCLMIATGVGEAIAGEARAGNLLPRVWIAGAALIFVLLTAAKRITWCVRRCHNIKVLIESDMVLATSTDVSRDDRGNIGKLIKKAVRKMTGRCIRIPMDYARAFIDSLEALRERLETLHGRSTLNADGGRN